MLLDAADDSPDCEIRHAIRAKALANILAQVIVGQGLVDVLNAIAVLTEDTVNAYVPKDAADQRENIAGHLRHLADHVDLTCPHVREAPAEAPETPPTPRRNLH